MTTVPLGDVLRHRKEFFQIEDGTDYQRVRIRLHVQGVGPRDRVKGHEIKTKRQQACRPGDFIVAEIDAKVGGYGFIPDELDGAIVSSHYFLFEVDEARLLPEYLAFCIRAPWFAAQISAQGSTNYAAIRPHDVLAIQIPLPSLDEQKRVAAHLRQALGDVEALRATYAVQASDVSELRRAILDDAVHGRLTEREPDDEPAETLLERISAEKQRLFKAGEIRKPKSLPPVGADEAPFEVPEGWAWTRIVDVCSYVQRGKQPKYIQSSAIPVISQKCVQWSHFAFDRARFVDESTLDSYTAERYLRDGDLLWNSTGLGTLGRIGIFPADEVPHEYVVADSHVTVVRSALKGDGTVPEYLLAWLSSPLVQSVIESEASGSTKQIELATSTVQKYPVPLPPAAEQRRIVERVDALMALCDQLDARLGAATEDAGRLAQAVLAEALAGGQTAM